MASTDRNRPNVVVILTDDQGPWAMGCAGNAEIQTPNLNRLAESGTRFTNLFCASPVCSPARASLLTGRIPSQHGIHDWLCAGNAPFERGRGLIEYLKDQPAYTDMLARHGYVCGMSGKWHLGDSLHPQKSFAFWEVHATGGGPYYDAPMVKEGRVCHEPAYVTDVITNNALSFLDKQADGDGPFYLSVHYTAPHSPWSRGNHPAHLWDQYFTDCPFASTPNTPMHPWQRFVPEWVDAYREPHIRRGLLSGYFSAITAMDEDVGRILNRLETMEIRENTLVFFTGDNGMNMGHHGIYGKGNGTFPLNMYDTSVKVPGIVSRPGSVAEGATCDALISHYDFLPTLLEYLDIENPYEAELPGLSFASLLRGAGEPHRKSIAVCDEYGPVRMIRTKDWKYVHRYPYGPHELYDLLRDPDEDKNLYDMDEYRPVVQEMKCALEDWFAEYADPLLDGTHEAVTGDGQCDLAGPAGRGAEAFQGGVRNAAEAMRE